MNTPSSDSGMVIFMPGRLCLFGEHSDWAGEFRRDDPDITPGCCIITGTDQGLHAEISANPGCFRIRSVRPGGHLLGEAAIPFSLHELKIAAESRGFESYAAATAWQILRHSQVNGISVNIHTMDLPLKKGLSSSAAVCVLTARAFNQLYSLNLSIKDEMNFAYHGELMTGSQCGRMDQACAFGRVPSKLVFDGADMTVQTLHPNETLHLLIVDLSGEKNTRRILIDLNAAFMAPQTPIGSGVRTALGELNKTITAAAHAAIEQGDARWIGELMREAQRNFDQFIAPACPAELDAPRLHALLNSSLSRSVALGGKGVGSQGDGCAQFIFESMEHRIHFQRQLTEKYGLQSFPLTIHPIP